MSEKSTPIRVVGAVFLVATAFFVGRWSSLREMNAASSAVDSVAMAPAPVAANQSATTAVAADPVAALAERAARLPQSLASDDARQKAIEEWARRDPLGAMEFVRANLKGPRRAQAMSSILAIWGQSDPSAAWSWVSNNEPTAIHHFDTLLETFGKSSPTTAARFVNEFVQTHPEAALEVNLAALLGITHSGDFGAARSFVSGTAGVTPEVRNNLNNFIAGQWARYDPEAAAAWALSLPVGPQRDQALFGLGDSWAGVDPAGAAKFAEKLPVGESRQVALRQAIGSWLQSEPDQARQWVMQNNEHEDYDQAVAAIATQSDFMFRESDRALRWAGAIFDEDIRFQSTRTILAGLYVRDPASALAYIRDATNLTGPQRAQLFSQFPPKE